MNEEQNRAYEDFNKAYKYLNNLRSKRTILLKKLLPNFYIEDLKLKKIKDDKYQETIRMRKAIAEEYKLARRQVRLNRLKAMKENQTLIENEKEIEKAKEIANNLWKEYQNGGLAE